MGRFAVLSLLLAILAFNVPQPVRWLVALAGVVVLVLATRQYLRLRSARRAR